MGCYPLKGEQNIEPPILEAFLFALNVLHLIMQEIERYKQLILSVLRRNLIKRAAIFGSVAKGNFNINSDLDLLVEGDASFTMFKLLSLEEEISELINRKVDLVEYNAIKPSIRQEVLQSAIAIL
jgi:predicted nucleotidyltransferase